MWEEWQSEYATSYRSSNCRAPSTAEQGEKARKTI
nr:MAG TPA: hypothetical protein [Caudoviricetes sp.]